MAAAEGASPIPLILRDVEHGRSVPLQAQRLIIGAFTGRDAAAVEAHIAELAEHGVPEPETVPSMIEVPSDLLVVAPTTIAVSTTTTSGEVEPVLVRLASGEMYLGVGSDHTDRDVEKTSIAAAKRACPKVLGRELWPFDSVRDTWDELVLSSQSGHGGETYQRAPLADIRPPHELLALADALVPDAALPLVLFLGTVPLLGGKLRFDRAFRGELHDPRRDRRLACEYFVDQDAEVRAPTTSPDQPATSSRS
jgi:hypothetical protein